MRRRPSTAEAMPARSWGAAAAMAVLGLAVFAMSLVSGLGLAMIWLPAVMVAAAWPRTPAGERRCLRRVRRRKPPDADRK
jgi:hypothetical protein